MRRLIESMDKISEAGPATPAAPQELGPLDTAIQNVQSTWATAKQVPGNIKRLVTDPVQYIKDLPAPSPEQMMTGWAGGAMKGGKLPAAVATPKTPMGSMVQQLAEPAAISSTGGKIATTPTGIIHTAGPKVSAPAQKPAPSVWRNPQTGETSSTSPGAKETTPADLQKLANLPVLTRTVTPAGKQPAAKETTPADLQKLANLPVTRTAEPGGRIEPKFDVDEEKIAPGTKFPGYWKGNEPASKSRSRMVGDESIIPSLAKQAKEKTLEWQIEEAYQQFKEADEYTGIDPIVRQRMGMQAATQDEIRSYLDKNPPGIKTGDGSAVTSGSGAPVQSGGQVNVARAADAASPNRPQSVARTPAKPLDVRNRSDGTLPPAPAAVKTPAPDSGAVATPVNPQAEYTALTIPAAAAPPAAPPAPSAAQSFGQAFAAARAAQQKASPESPGTGKFNWTNPRTGKTASYHTGLKSEMPDPSVTPKPAAPAAATAAAPVAPAATAVKPATAAATTRGISTSAKRADPTAGEAKDAAAQAAADIDPTAPLKPMSTSGVKGGSFTAPPGYKLGTMPSGAELNISPLRKPVAAPPAAKPTDPNARPPINRTPLTRQEFNTINANDRAAAAAAARRAAGAQKNEAVNKLAEQFAAFMEEQDQYGPEYQAMVKRVGDRARQGAMKTVWDPVKRVYKNVPVKQEKQVKEYENAQDQDSQVTSQASPAATASSQAFTADKELQNMNAQKTLEADAGNQDPNAQTTSPASPAAVAKTATAPAAPDVSVATAKTTMAGLKPALGPGVDTNAAATGVTKANLGQALNPAEQQAVSALTPLVMKAATIPSAAPQLRSALTNAGTMARATAAKQGKM